MTDNPKSYEVILFDHFEMKHDESGEYLSVFNLDGTNYKISPKRQHLWGVFNKSSKGTLILLTFETFTNERKEQITFVSDAQVCNFDAIHKAAIQTTLKRLLLAKDDDRIRSQALAYAKDVWVAQISTQQNVTLDMGLLSEKVLKLAAAFFYFIKGQQDIEVPHIEGWGKPLITEEEYQK